MKYTPEIKEAYGRLHNSSHPWKSLAAEKSYYESFIRDFFSVDKEANQIKDLFMAVESNTDTLPNRINFANANAVYKEYLDGMKAFVEEVCEYDDASEANVIESYNTQLQTATEKDHLFIDSIFSNGAFNPVVEESTQESAGVLSEMVDFIDAMNTQEDACNKLLIESTNRIKIGSLKLLCESVSYYWLNALTNMVESYETLCESVLSDEEKKERPTFVLV